MIDYEDSIFIILKARGSLVPKALLCSAPAAIATFVLHIIEEQFPDFATDYYDIRINEAKDIKQGLLWNAMSVAILLLLMFRSFQALGRFWEGTSLLHKMRGEWFDCATLCFAWSRDAKLHKIGFEEPVNEFRSTLTRLMSLMHGCALEEISSDDPMTHYTVLDLQGLDEDTLKFLKDCREVYHFNTVEAIQHIIQVLITHNHHSGVLTIAPPILGRVYQSLSRGLVNLLNAKKIKDTMFPFPYAQSCLVLLLVHSLFVPIMVTQVVDNKYFAVAIAWPIIFAMFCVNFVAAELEMPFGMLDNHLPMRHFQTEFNHSLLMLNHGITDHLSCTCPHAIKDFNRLGNFRRDTFLEKTTKFAKKMFIDSHSKSYNAPGFLQDHEAIENALPSFIDSDEGLSPAPSVAASYAASRRGSRGSVETSLSNALGRALDARKVKIEEEPREAPASEADAPLPQLRIPPCIPRSESVETWSPGRSIPAESDVPRSAMPRVASAAESFWEQQDVQRQLEADLNILELRRSTSAMHSTCASLEEALAQSTDAMKEATARVLSFLQMPEQMASTPMRDSSD